MTDQFEKQGEPGRQIFTPGQEKPVAIFLPQHRPGRTSGPSLPVIAAAVATVAVLSGSLYLMMPRSDVSVAPALVADAGESRSVRTASAAAGPEVDRQQEVVGAITADEPTPVSQAAEAASAAAAATSAAAVRAAPSAAEIPSANDPRWARVEAPSRSAALEAVKKLMVEKATQTDEDDSGLLAYAGGERSLPDFPDPSSDVRRPMQIVLPADLPEQPDGGRVVAVTASVNLRSGPSNKYGVMAVIPRRAKVEVYDCDHWCKVGYEGRTGYVYKSFVGGRSS